MAASMSHGEDQVSNGVVVSQPHSEDAVRDPAAAMEEARVPETVASVPKGAAARTPPPARAHPKGVGGLVKRLLIAVGLTSEKRGKSKAEIAQHAHKIGDKELMLKLHNPEELMKLMGTIEEHEEPVSLDGGVVKPLVFGGLDGIITTFAVVAGAIGAELNLKQTLIMGFANLIADGFSMGFGEYTSSKAELEFAINERAREEWEFENHPDGEMKEMVDLYKEKNISEQDACTVISTLAKYKEFFIDHMMVEELGLMPPDIGESPLKQGFIMFMAFIMFGSVPLIGFVVLATVATSQTKEEYQKTAFAVSCGLTALTLFILGTVKARYTKQSKILTGLIMLANGTVAGGAAFGIGEVLNLVMAD